MDNRGTSMDIVGPAKSQHLLSRQVDEARYFFLDLGPGANAGPKLAFGGRERCRPDYRIARRDFGYHGVEYVAAGRGWVTLEGVRTELRPGSVFAYSAEMACAMETSADDPLVKYFFCFSGRTLRARLKRAHLLPGTTRHVAHHGELRAVADDLIRQGQRATRHTPEICAVLFDLLLLRLAEAPPTEADPGEPARQNFARCQALIDAEAGTLRTLDEIARRVGLEKSSVCRLFRRFLGTSPYQYLLRQKMNRAAELLLHHGGLVKEVAERVGFADPFHFSRGFKAVHGQSPSQLRAKSGR
jgi:AraC-like DNA-binding protein